MLLGILIYTEYSNCLMYLGPTSTNYDQLCLLVCIIPMLTTAIVECRLFAYFMLMKERLRIINQSIDFFTNNDNSFTNNISKTNRKLIENESKIFFISELVGPKKSGILIKTKATKSNFLFKSIKSGTRFLKNLFNIRKNKIFADNFDAIYKSSTRVHHHERHIVEQVCSMQIIYTKLYEITELISKAYGVQIIAIISVQFITLTTLMYHSTMKTIR